MQEWVLELLERVFDMSYNDLVKRLGFFMFKYKYN